MTRSLRILFLLAFALVAPSLAIARAPDAAEPAVSQTDSTAHQQVEQALQTWLQAIGTGTPDAVMKLYADNAVLLPTLSPVIRTTVQARKDYFDEFTAKKNLKGVLDEQHIQLFGDTAINSGLYTFTYTENGQTLTVPARFTFVYRQTPQGWIIVEHHSSKLPAAH